MQIKNLGVIAGGYSGEAEVSLRSAATLIHHLKDTDFNVILIKIDKVNWKAHWQEKEYNIDKNDFSFQGPQGKVKIDYAYIIIHGTPGEDGKIGRASCRECRL